MLTRANYGDWALLMKVMLECRHLWEAIESSTTIYGDNRLALEVILLGVPPEVMATLAAKATAKEARNPLKMMRLGVERVRETKLVTLSKQYIVIRFTNGEAVDDFAVRIRSMVTQMAQLSEAVPLKRVVSKFSVSCLSNTRRSLCRSRPSSTSTLSSARN